MDVHSVIATAVEEVLEGVKAANAELVGKARIGDATRIEIEFGITATYEVANYDDLRIATVRATLPILPGGEEGSPVGPATAALAKEEPPKKTDKSEKKRK